MRHPTKGSSVCGNGVGRRPVRCGTAVAIAAMAATLQLVLAPAAAEPGGAAAGDAPAYLSSPWHGMIDGNGERIPCRCRFAGREWRLGDLVCMSTHLGTVLARCDLHLNNTSWVPTATPCELSLAPRGATVAVARPR